MGESFQTISIVISINYEDDSPMDPTSDLSQPTMLCHHIHD